ncbi:MAG: acetyltransferase, partial [Myxococcota bacterium]
MAYDEGLARSGRSPARRERASVGSTVKMGWFDHVRSALTLTVITLNLAFWVIALVVLGFTKGIAGPVRPAIDRVLEGCYRVAIAIDDAWLRGVMGARWRNPDLALPKDELCIVVSNHASWADILLLQSAIARRGPLLKFLTKRELAFIPIFGVIFWAFDFPLLRRVTKEGQDEAARRAADAEALSAACEAVRRRPAALTNFVEGTRASPEKIAARGGPYRNLLPPRVGGFASLVEALDGDLDSVLDVTLVSPERPAFWAFLSGRLPEIEVRA